ncbi:MAG: glycoside hydrolase family 25 protein [Actinobacteria bacterium]|nr:glycoside hydrolase family 25 protein [Actinomycetota bacterium]
MRASLSRVAALRAGTGALIATALVTGALLATGTASAATTLEGIDVGTSQSGLNFSSAAGAGISFAIVKAGGSQLSAGPYVSPYYAAEVDKARAAGMKVGHYWVSGDYQTPTAAADYFVGHLHDYRAGDVVALDDEVLDDSTTLWNDSKVAAFFQEVKLKLGTVVPWFYISASPLRAASWTATIATGAKLWVASYGSNTGSYPGEPNIGTAYPSWSAHQYTSKGAVGGLSAVDRDRAVPSAFDLVGSGGGTGTGGSTGLPKTTTQYDGVPGTVFWQRCQHWLSIMDGYTGPIDGSPGTNTYMALQRDLAAHWGYTGPIDGSPGTYTYMAWQRMAATYGYTGPIDGVMGPNSYRAIATFLNEDRWD